MKLEIDLTEQQEKFLKLFAEKHYSGAEDNRYTADCLHVVETKRERYIPYHEDLWDYYCDLPLKFTKDSDHENWHDDEMELIQEYFDDNEIDGIEIVSYDNAYLNYIVGVNNEECFISSHKDYFDAYGIECTGISWVEDCYEPVAYFFILEEAKKYLKYQSHNLRHPRVYTYSAGYGNCGDFVQFRDLLLKMGTTLKSKF